MNSGRTSPAVALLALVLGLASPAGGGFLVRIGHPCPAQAASPDARPDSPGEHHGQSSRDPGDCCHCVGECHAPGVLPGRPAPGPVGYARVQEPLPGPLYVAEAPVALPLDLLPPATAPPDVVRA